MASLPPSFSFSLPPSCLICTPCRAGKWGGKYFFPYAGAWLSWPIQDLVQSCGRITRSQQPSKRLLLCSGSIIAVAGAQGLALLAPSRRYPLRHVLSTTPKQNLAPQPFALLMPLLPIPECPSEQGGASWVARWHRLGAPGIATHCLPLAEKEHIQGTDWAFLASIWREGTSPMALVPSLNCPVCPNMNWSDQEKSWRPKSHLAKRAVAWPWQACYRQRTPAGSAILLGLL